MLAVLRDYKTGFLNNLMHAYEDLKESLSRLSLVIWMGWLSTFVPFRGSTIGPYWMTLQTLAWAASISFIFRPGLSATTPFFTYVALGITIYSTITIFISEGSEAFIKEYSIILNIPNPFLIYIIKLMVRAVVNVVMSLPVVILAIYIDGVALTMRSLLVIPGMILLFLFGFGISTFFATSSTRYRDIRFSMTLLMRFLFFTTPVFWYKTSGIREIIADLNPLYHMLLVIRGPILGVQVDMHNYFIAISLTVISLLLGGYIFAVMRPRMAQWL